MENKTENLCPICFTEITEKTNFCPSCGEPISSLAKQLERDKQTNTELFTLMKVMDFMKDERDLKFIKGLIDRLAK